MADRPRIIVALADRVEAANVADWLAADGFEPIKRPTPQAAIDEMRARPFDLLITDAGMHGRAAVSPQGRARRPLTPPLVIGTAIPSQRGDAMALQPMHLTRPVDRALLACYVSMAMLEGNPVRKSVRKIVNRFDAVVNGVPSHIVDVSTEGMRLELPREQRAALPPYFTVRVPLVGVGVTVQRMWSRTAPGQTSTLWYGGALAPNRPNAVQGWRSFVDTIPLKKTPGGD